MTPLCILLAFAALAAAAPAPAETPSPAEQAEEKPLLSTEELPEAEDKTEPHSLLSGEEFVARGEEFLDRASRAAEVHARELFTLALGAEPENAAARAGLARCAATRYLRRWEEDDALIDQALEHARAAVEMAPRDPRAHAALAVALIVSGDWVAALDEADAAWTLGGEERPAWVTQVYVQSLVTQGKHGDALRIVDEALTAQPTRAQFHGLRGAALRESGDLQEAVQALRRALVLEPDLVPAAIMLAHVYEQLGNRFLAANLYNEIVRRFPEESARVHTIMVSSLVARGLCEDALSALEGIRFGTRRGLGEGTLLYMKATCLEKMRRTEEARTLYRKVIDEYPFASFGAYSVERLGASAQEALSRVALEEGDAEEAVRLLEEALTMPRPTIALFVKLASLYADYNLHSEAVSALRKAEKIDFGPRQAGPKTAIYVAWARALRAADPEAGEPLGEVIEALEHHRPALLATKDYPYFLEAARACALAGDPSRGVDWLRRAVDLGYRHLDWISGDPEMRSLAEAPGFSSLSASVSGR